MNVIDIICKLVYGYGKSDGKIKQEGRKYMGLFRWIKKIASAVFLDTVSRRIREVRTLREISRHELARKCGISFLKLLCIECNLANIDIHTCRKLGEALDISWLYLAGIIDEKKPVSYGLSTLREDLKRECGE